jgi:hypothetical protein
MLEEHLDGRIFAEFAWQCEHSTSRKIVQQSGLSPFDP